MVLILNENEKGMRTLKPKIGRVIVHQSVNLVMWPLKPDTRVTYRGFDFFIIFVW